MGAMTASAEEESNGSHGANVCVTKLKFSSNYSYLSCFPHIYWFGMSRRFIRQRRWKNSNIDGIWYVHNESLAG